MQEKIKIKSNERKINLIKRRIKNRKFQKEVIYKCSPGEVARGDEVSHVNDKAWDVIWFIALHYFSGKPLTSSDVYLGTALPKRTVIRILERLERLNVIVKQPGSNDARVRLINFSRVFAFEVDHHLQECITEGI